MNLQTIKIAPKKLFIIDGIGAILSAFLLGIVLVRFESVFGIPIKALYFLATIPVLFFLFDLYCLVNVLDHTATKLKIIALANCLYCVLSISLVTYHINSVTTWGWLYMLFEVLIVLMLALFEFGTAKLIHEKRR